MGNYSLWIIRQDLFLPQKFRLHGRLAASNSKNWNPQNPYFSPFP